MRNVVDLMMKYNPMIVRQRGRPKKMVLVRLKARKR